MALLDLSIDVAPGLKTLGPRIELDREGDETLVTSKFYDAVEVNHNSLSL